MESLGQVVAVCVSNDLEVSCLLVHHLSNQMAKVDCMVDAIMEAQGLGSKGTSYDAPDFVCSPCEGSRLGLVIL